MIFNKKRLVADDRCEGCCQ